MHILCGIKMLVFVVTNIYIEKERFSVAPVN